MRVSPSILNKIQSHINSLSRKISNKASNNISGDGKSGYDQKSIWITPIEFKSTNRKSHISKKRKLKSAKRTTNVTNVWSGESSLIDIINTDLTSEDYTPATCTRLRNIEENSKMIHRINLNLSKTSFKSGNLTSKSKKSNSIVQRPKSCIRLRGPSEEYTVRMKQKGYLH